MVTWSRLAPWWSSSNSYRNIKQPEQGLFSLKTNSVT